MQFLALVMLCLPSILATFSKPLNPYKNASLKTQIENAKARFKAEEEANKTKAAFYKESFAQLECFFEKDAINKMSAIDCCSLLTAHLKRVSERYPGDDRPTEDLLSWVQKYSTAKKSFDLLLASGSNDFKTIKRSIMHHISVSNDGFVDISLRVIKSIPGRTLDGSSSKQIILHWMLRYISVQLYNTGLSGLPAFIEFLENYKEALLEACHEYSKVPNFKTAKQQANGGFVVTVLQQFVDELSFQQLFCIESIAQCDSIIKAFSPFITDTVPCNSELPKIIPFHLLMDRIMNNNTTVKQLQNWMSYPEFKIRQTDLQHERIKKELEKHLELIKLNMDLQFPDYEPIADINNDENNAVSIKDEEASKQSTVEISERSPLADSDKENRRKTVMETFKQNKQRREEAELEKQKNKHSKLVQKIKEDNVSFNEEDDGDVSFYYSSRAPLANDTFLKNQTNKACTNTYPASKRYRHSLYPTVTASGETIKYLCDLLVSGAPTYGRHCMAHADLGGVLENKKNGGKKFTFGLPITYHKTLHAPHLSSKFDHRLYRRFYRNCGLHPYFFVLAE